MQSSGSFYRFGQRDDRRRRLLGEDASDRTEQPWGVPSLAPKSEHYGDGEFLEQQLRLLDLVPRRALTVVLLLFVGAGVIAGLEFGYLWMLNLAANGHSAVAALDLSAKASLAGWFSSLLLLAASVATILVYSVRRHRVDDYRGWFRIWFWASVCWFVLAADQVCGLREAFRDLMVWLTGTKLAGDGSPWWVVLYAVVLGAVGSRLLIDMRRNPLAIGFLLTAAAAQIAAVAIRLDWFEAAAGSRTSMWISGLEMSGNLTLLTAMGLHARHVLFDAEGLLPSHGTEADEDEEEESVVLGSDHWVKIDPPHNVGTQPVLQRVTPPNNTAFSASSSSLPTTPLNRKLTKGEKKALKERLLRDRMKREGKL